jgi:hypothetical protein
MSPLRSLSRTENKWILLDSGNMLYPVAVWVIQRYLWKLWNIGGRSVYFSANVPLNKDKILINIVSKNLKVIMNNKWENNNLITNSIGGHHHKQGD